MHETPAGQQGLQPLLHEAVVAFLAPTQVWSGRDGSIGSAAIDGVYVSDVRIIQTLRVLAGGQVGEHLATVTEAAQQVAFHALFRNLDSQAGADPDVRGELLRTARPDGVRHEFRLRSRLATAVDTDVVIELRADLTSIDRVKSGRGAAPDRPHVEIDGEQATWSGDGVAATLRAPGGRIEAAEGAGLRIAWPLHVDPRGTATVAFDLAVSDSSGVVASPGTRTPWREPDLASADRRLGRWVRRSLSDLDALRLVTRRAPGGEFLAAGAPWFFTLFGRDAIWSARMLTSLGPELPLGTLRVLAALQGTASSVETAEEPGKIMHELRRAALEVREVGGSLPPLYYGTIDATPLWVCLLADARDAGAADDDIRSLLPALRAAIGWMRDFGDTDGDGLLEYVDESGRGLSNQGWKDSGDSVQWRDGRLATAPIALCEVQAYAYEAATRGAALLEALEPSAGAEAAEWRAWAERLAARFRESFWVQDAAGAYPAIALDAHKRPVDSVTSNLGHLLGTGLLNEAERALVARRLVSPALDSGWGLRTMSSESVGYWPLSYHGGSVWTHDTAIAVRGLARDGFRAEAEQLAEGLLRAAVAFDYRMPELYSGESEAAVPYPAACRPQAWSAAAAIAVLDALR